MANKFKKTITILMGNSKGGVAKTTSTFIASHILHDDYGLECLMVDGDGSCSLTTMCCGEENVSLYNEKNLYTALTKEDMSIKDCIIDVGGVKLLPSNTKLEEGERYIESKGGNVNHALKKKLKDVIDTNFFDVCCIDCKPTVTTLTRNYIVASDYIVLVYQAKHQCLLDSKSMLSAIAQVNEELKDIGLPEKKVLGCLLTMTDNTVLCKEVVQEITESLNAIGIKIYQNTIPRTVKIDEATTQNLSTNLYAPKSAGNKAYKGFVEELLEDLKKEGVYNG